MLRGGDQLPIGLRDVDLDNRVRDEGGAVVPKWNEDAIFVDWFRFVFKGEGVGSMEDVLVEQGEVAVVPDGGVDQRCPV